MKEKIINWINENTLDGNTSVSEDTDLLDGSILDSMGVISLIVFLQDECGITVDVTELNIDSFRNVNSIIDLIEGCRK